MLGLPGRSSPKPLAVEKLGETCRRTARNNRTYALPAIVKYEVLPCLPRSCRVAIVWSVVESCNETQAIVDKTGQVVFNRNKYAGG